MKQLVFATAIILACYTSHAQVGIGNTNPNASLDISATNTSNPANTDGILIPRVNEFPTTNPTAAQDAMMIFISGSGTAARGFYYWDHGTTSWIVVGSGNGIEKIDDLTDGKSDNDGIDDGSSIFLGVDAGATDDGSSNANVGIGFTALEAVTGGRLNTAIGWGSLRVNTGSSNTAVGYLSGSGITTGTGNTVIGRNSLISNTIGNYNTTLGFYAGRSNTGSGNQFLGANAGFNHSSGSNIMYIDNTDAGVDAALIYGEFGSDNTTAGNILRTNSEFQIGNPAGTGYAFPINDGSANQVLATDGAGQISFVAPSSGEWTDGGAYLTPMDGTSEEVLIGTTTSADGKLVVNSNGKTAAIETNLDGSSSYGTYNKRDSGNSGLKYGVYNQIGGSNSTFSTYGTYNNITASGDGARIASYNTVNTTGNGSKYGSWNTIPSTTPGTHYGVFSEVLSSSGNAGYFRGRLSFGDFATSRYIMPPIDGAAGQVIVTDGSGQLSFGNLADSDWTIAGNDIYSALSGFVGIGDITPDYQLDVVYSGTSGATANVDFTHTANSGIGSGLDVNAETTGFGNIFGGYFHVYNSNNGVTSTAVYGLNSANADSNYGLRASVVGSGTTNLGVFSIASGATENWAGYFGNGVPGANNGNVFVNDQLYVADEIRYTDGNQAVDRVLRSDATGIASWVDPSTVFTDTDTDDQTIDNFGLSGDTLGLSLEDDGQAVQTVDLSSVSYNISNFALAKMTMSALQVHPVSSWTKQNFDGTTIDIGSNFDTSTDRFDVTEAGHYRITASYRSTINIATNNLFGISVYVNGAAIRTEIMDHYASGVVIRKVETIETLAVGDYIEIYFFANAALTVTNSTLYTSFEVERIR